MNREPTAYKADALPIELERLNLCGLYLRAYPASALVPVAIRSRLKLPVRFKSIWKTDGLNPPCRKLNPTPKREGRQAPKFYTASENLLQFQRR